MNKKGQINIGQVLVTSVIFVILVIGGFNFYLGSLYANEVSIPAGINQADLNATFSKFDTSIANTANSTYENRNRIPILSGIRDFFSAGVDSIKAAYDSIGFMNDYVAFVKKDTVLGAFLPQSFWGLLVSIFTIILTLIGLSALWRWNLTR